ncbi:MAG: HAD family phosphatase [Candidatus Cloacimonetes bacterium]|nr:HAD family phosphatase [Candidatus Cloacimonadota bacterium]
MNIIFDLGKVLVELDFTNLYSELQYDTKTDLISEYCDPVIEFESGNLSSYDFYLQLKKIYQFQHSFREFENVWCSIFTDLTPLVEYARELNADHKVFVLSNTDELHFRRIWQDFPELHFFEDNLMLSYELKSVKPNKEIFNRALEKFDLQSGDCIFVDDKVENVKTAEGLGIKAVLYTDSYETQKTVKQILNSVKRGENKCLNTKK